MSSRAGDADDASERDGADHDAGGVAIDLEQVERDLAGVEAALQRLDDGTYWTDEVSGEPLTDELLAADPVARRQPRP